MGNRPRWNRGRRFDPAHLWQAVLSLGRLGPVAFVTRVVRKFIADDCTGLASSIAYYGLFSLFPLMLGLIAVLGFVMDENAVRERLVQITSQFLVGADSIVGPNLSNLVQARGPAGIIAALVLAWSASAVFGVMSKAFDRAWEVEKSRSLPHQKLVDLAMVMGTGLLLFLSLALTAFGRFLREWQEPISGLRPFQAEWLWALSTVALPIVLTFALFLLAYKTVPRAKVSWSSAAVGATVAALLFEVAKNVFAWYVPTLAHYELVYGSLAAVIVLLTWAQLSSLILLLGAEVGAEHARSTARRNGGGADEVVLG